ncbi:MAG TPA: hypothetical protein VGM90_19390 [Kofleriaceae bacterium]|jgi:hypothetical protein
MTPGITEIITLLLGMAGFGVQADPNPPTADASLQYAIPDADVVVHFDAAMVVPNNYKVLTALPTNAAVKASPDAAKMVHELIGQIEGARGMAKMATGIDPVTDVQDATFFIRVRDKEEPTFLAEVHGKFSQANVTAIAGTMGGTPTQVGSASMVSKGPKDPAIGVTKDGVMLVGNTDLVKARLADSWKAPARASGSAIANAYEVLGGHPVYAVVGALSPSAKKHVLSAMDMGPKKNFITDMVNRGKSMSFAVYADGIGWTWVDTTKVGLDDMELMSQGTLDMMKAAHIFPRGMAKVLLGALDSYKGTDKEIDAVIAHKADVMKLVTTYTGDGNFQQSVVKDPKTMKLTVRATGKSLSEVVPAGIILPGMAAALLFRAGPVAKSETMIAEPAQPPALTPRKTPPPPKKK